MDFIHALQSQGKKASVESGWLTFLGIFNVLLGIFAVAFTGLSTYLSVIYLGWLLIFSGTATVFLSFKLKRIGGHWSLFIFGVLAVVFGGLMLADPSGNALVLTLLASAFIFSTGVVSLISCFFAPFEHKAWVVFSSLVSIACGVVIYTQWPSSGAWVPGTFFGVYLIFHGMTQFQIGSAGRRLLKGKAPAR